MISPQTLPPNQIADRFYRGGARIAAFRRAESAPPDAPEDWVASTTTLYGEETLGLSSLVSGELLVDAIHRDPVAWLGPVHVRAFGENTGLLVKLLDAGQRLPVHVHPGVQFAKQHLGLVHGKTEAWVFLSSGEVHLGFERDVSTDELTRWVHDQDTDAMLAAMHSLQVERGDAVFVPAGLPHALGEGCFLIELQEPTDLSILLEWEGFEIDGRADGHLGLGHETALRAVDRSEWERGDIELLRSSRAGDVGDLLPAAAPFFRASRTHGDAVWDGGYGVAVVTEGSGAFVAGDGGQVAVQAGDTLVVPFAAGRCRVQGGPELEVIHCRPPRPA